MALFHIKTTPSDESSECEWRQGGELLYFSCLIQRGSASPLPDTNRSSAFRRYVRRACRFAGELLLRKVNGLGIIGYYCEIDGS